MRVFFFQELPPHAYFVRVRLGWSIQRLRGSRGVTQPARFQGSTRFYEAAHGYWSRIWTMNLWVYWIEGYLKWPSFFPSYNEKRKNHVETWNKKESTLGSHVMLLTCYKGLLNFPDRTGWGVSRHYLLTRSSSEWGWVGLLSGSVAGEVIPIRPVSKHPSRVLWGCPRHLFADRIWTANPNRVSTPSLAT